ncbi:MAG: AAA family ATPase [Planctomycetes bacterium]|nr:AAA family ATPase [Planctomycetota bacterium]MCC7397784.1 AAA family ATPase [Planctomycetota bacterium]
MLKRLRVDNFRSLGNTTLEPSGLSLLIGDNGSGKTSLFEVLDLLRQLLVDGARVGDLFPATTLTRWRRETAQRFQLCIEIADSSYDYEVAVEHVPDQGKVRISEERLAIGGKPLFATDRGHARLYRDDHSEGPPLLMDWSRSGIAALEPSPDNTQLVRFRQACSRILLARISPTTMQGRADGEVAHPLPDFSNFAAWYRHLSQEQPERMRDLFDDLKHVVPGFEKLRPVAFPDNVRDLRAEIDCEGKRCEYRFAELSDGQRSLVALYTILHCGAEPGGLLLLDEPDNFVALAELQPWLVAFADKIRSAGCQAIVISHHPECIDYLAGGEILLAKRADGGSTVVGPWQFDATRSLTPSEAIARGWIDD